VGVFPFKMTGDIVGKDTRSATVIASASTTTAETDIVPGNDVVVRRKVVPCFVSIPVFRS
jgi:hypothetical protein